MKRLIMLAVGTGLLLGSVSFAQDAKKTDDSSKTAKKRKAKKLKKATTTSTDKKM